MPKLNSNSFSIIALLSFPLFLLAQTDISHLTQDFKWRNLGPANQGGRITDIEAVNNDFAHVYIAAASGGVWKSENAGTSWKPIFDDYEAASIGDIALDPNDQKTIWVGTGEANNRNSVSWGNGIYKSTDGGQNFENKGLESTHQIARVLVHPERSDEVCVCAIGHLWGYSGERGLFKTTNGGDKWEKMTNGLPSDGKTGCTDLIQDPKSPNILYAAFYHRLREPWHFEGGGQQGGIYKSVDGGKSWSQLKHGLPTGPTGRIGLAIYPENPNIIMAIVEAPKTNSLKEPGSGIYRSEDGGATWKYINQYNNRPFYYSQIRINPSDDQRVYVLTTKIMVSEDGGHTFKNGSEDQEVHGDFHAMWLDPNDKDRYYLGADKGFSVTHDHGQHFQLIDNLPIAQYYRINYDMRDPYYVYGGLQDNGSYATASFSRDARGILSDANWKMHWGDGQDAAANPNDWTDMYSSMENGSYYKYNPKTRNINRISPNSFNTSNHWDYFDKDAEDKVTARRFNWSAPLVMSVHDPSTIYVGGNHLYRTKNKGENWEIISPDLSTDHPIKKIEGHSGGVTADNTGAETHCSITAISESVNDKNLIWVGTDDGNIQVTKNGGKDWVNVRGNIKDVPNGIWVSRVVASKFKDGRAYVSFDGHRSDRFDSWIYVTNDFGKSWQRITNGFSTGETVRVIREDVKNPKLLFAGTETGVWVTIDQGKSWNKLKLNMPTVSVYDMKIHPRENDLIVGTHGRSLWILNDISPLQQLAEIEGKSIHLFKQKPNTQWENISRGGQRGHFWFAGDNPGNIQNTTSIPRAGFKTNAAINYFVGSETKDSIVLRINDPKTGNQKEIKLNPKLGFHRYYWNREFDTEGWSQEEWDELDHLLHSITDEIDNSRVRRIYRQFKELTDHNKVRRLIKPLTGGYLSVKIDSKFLIPEAGPGTYQLELNVGGKKSKAELIIQEDPILKEK